MVRRNFIKSIYIGSSLFVLGKSTAACSTAPISLKFGLITDLHYAQNEISGSRHYKDSLNKLKKAMDVFEKNGLDFVIELGDFKDQSQVPNNIETLTFLDKIETVYQSYNLEAYHVLGNHDMDSISKSDFLDHTSNPGEAKGKSYYSFVKNGVKCIVLDACYNLDGSDYNSGNFDWTKALIPEVEKTWLQRELSEGKEPILVFVHQLLDINSDINNVLCITNALDITNMLEKCRRVLAVFQGHHHAGHYEIHNGIHYFTMKGSIEGSFPERNSYATVEVTPQGDIYLTGYADCVDKIMKKTSNV